HAPVRKPIEKLRKGIGKTSPVAERVGAREGGVGTHAERRRAVTEALAQNGEQQSFTIVERANERPRAPALPHPGLGRLAACDREQRLAHLRKQLDVLVAVNEIRRAAEMLREGAY